MTSRIFTALALTLSASTASVAHAGTVTLDLLKFYDSNANGVYDGDPALRGVRFAVKYTPPGGATVVTTVVSDVSGGAWVDMPAGSSFLVCERIPLSATPGQDWQQTMPSATTMVPGAMVTFVAGQWCYAGIAPLEGWITLPFGNVCIGGDGRTPGFWSNQNGEAILAGDDPHWRDVLNAYNLRDEEGNHFVVPGGTFASAYGVFETWIHGNGTNMSYKLSSHLAAMLLNVTYGFVPGTSLVYAPGTQSANAAGYAVLNDLIAEANAELALHGSALSGDPWRPYQEKLKNALDQANNGEDFPQSVQCGIDC